MKPYLRIVHYYETDQMKITHHSNYIRWMEEARIDFLEQLGFGYDRLEKEGIISPILSVHCDYKKSTTFNDSVQIDVQIKEYKGTRLILSYIMTNVKTLDIVATGDTTLCFLNEQGRPVILKKAHSEFHNLLEAQKENI